jgi:hypothetical protein
MRLHHSFACIVVSLLSFLNIAAGQDSNGLRKDAAEALSRAVKFFRQNVSTEGGYLWRYSHDLARREGERTASDTTVWVQPPGTPSVGEALLGAWRATGQRQYLDAARDAAMCLVRGQLQSGGWDYQIDFAPQDRARYAYRVEGGDARKRNVSTLDDNTTQAALRLLMHVDEALEFKDSAIHEATEYGLQALVKVQYPNGAWPQRYSGPPEPANHPVLKASYPESWSRTFPGVNYQNYYTFNDNALADCIDVMFEAARRYKQPAYREAAEKAGGFILLAQMPEPQPAWAQQYDAQMHPAWARKFEPPSVTGGESQGVLRTLLRLYAETGDKRYLAPVPPALEYLRRSRLPEGRLARFYELKTNKPLYFTKQYELTYSDADMPTHYGFKTGDSTDSIQREYERLSKLDPAQLPRRDAPDEQRRPSRASENLARQVRSVIDALDERGAWVENGRLSSQGDDDATRRIIECRTFIRNVGVLSSYLAAPAE